MRVQLLKHWNNYTIDTARGYYAAHWGNFQSDTNPMITLVLFLPAFHLTYKDSNEFHDLIYFDTKLKLPTSLKVSWHNGFFYLQIRVLGFGLGYSRQSDY